MRYNLSEVNDLIRNRRTVYPEQYTSRKVQKEMIEVILNNALWAPTHGKTQPWRFKVYLEEGRKSLADKMDQLYRQYTPEDKFNQFKLERIRQRIETTSALVLVAMKRTPETAIPEIEEVEAVSCAVQNMLLTATAYGLGSFWSSPGFLYNPDAVTSFGFEQEDKILGLVYLGYPKEEPVKGHRRPLEFVTEWIDG